MEDEVTEQFRILHNELVLQFIHIIWNCERNLGGWAGHVALIGRQITHAEFKWRSLLDSGLFKV